MPAQDFTQQFNTQLSPEEEQQFQQWIVASGRSLNDLFDYDLRGAWKSGVAQDPRGHLPDTWKKPNHPTFSTESMYNNGQYQGGAWVQLPNGGWTFTATPWNVQNYGAQDLQQYFSSVEPDSKLVLPQTAPAAASIPSSALNPGAGTQVAPVLATDPMTGAAGVSEKKPK